MQRTLLVGMGLVLVGGVVTPAMPVGVDSASAAVTGAAMPFDFDGDGYADLAVGVWGEDLRGVRDAGAVQVLYGSAAGVTARDQLWHQGRKGIKNKLEKDDHFGQALASGDFDADGFADLAVGIPSEDIAIDWNKVVFNMLTISGIYGRRMYETWYKMTVMLQGGLDISPVITHHYDYTEFEKGFEVMKSGQSGKVILKW